MKPILSISLKAIQNNYRHLQSICAAEIAAAVKADAYGLGASKIVPALYDAGCRKFFVATIDEGVDIASRMDDVSIYILNGFTESTMHFLIDHNLIPVINTPEQLNLWQDRQCAIHIDTGMNRLGMNLDDFTKHHALPHNVEFLMSHLACDGDEQNPYNKKQLEKFIAATAKYPQIRKSLAASGGAFLGPEYHFDMIRAGAAIYGLGARRHDKLQNPVSLYAPIIQIRKCVEDEYVGYGATRLAKKGSVLATIPLGYADGFSRFLSNNGLLYLGNKPVEIMGRISMDLTIIDVTEHEAKLGDMVEILGPNLYPDDLAERTGTIGYEVITSLKQGRFAREYIS